MGNRSGFRFLAIVNCFPGDRRAIFPARPAAIDRESMKQDDKDKGSSRQDRLKLALRENLKRRKSQARGRSESGTSSAGDKVSPDDAGEQQRG